MGGGVSAYTEALAVLRAEVCQLKKHRDQTWEWVVDNDPFYAKWVLLNVEDLDEDIRAALEVLLP